MKKFLILLIFLMPLFSVPFSYGQDEVLTEEAAAEETTEETTEQDNWESLDEEFEESESTAEESAEEPKDVFSEEEPAVDTPAEVEAEEEVAEEAETEDLEAIEPEEEAEVAEDVQEETTVDETVAQEMQPTEDSPDLNLEARLHNIFINFHNSKTPDDEWNTMVGERKVENYQIQKGDNLWNISGTIFGDGNYWPKVWSLNSSIRNPHLIDESNYIRFLVGTESEPPAFTVTEGPAPKTGAPKMISQGSGNATITTINSSSATTTSTDGLDELPEVPPPLKESRPVLRKIPPSLPEWQDQSKLAEYDDLGIDYGKRRIVDIEDKVFLPGYIAEAMPEVLGKVEEVEVGHNIASSYQYIYVAMQKGMGDVGDTYLVVRNRGEIKTTVPGLKVRGIAIDIQGEVQLVERVTSEDNNKVDMYRALVLQIVNPVSVGSVLTKGEIEKMEISEKGPRSQVVAEIIGGVFFEKRQIYGTESVAFLNRGESDGLQEGQVLPIRANLSLRNAGSRVRSNVRPIGWLRILRTTPNLATAVIVRAWSDVITGDLTGSGELMRGQLRASGPTEDEEDEDSDLGSELDDESDEDADEESEFE